MEIILLEDVKSLGKKGEKYKVSDGYGRNLISKKLCLEANAKNLNDLKLQKKHEEKVAQEKLDAASALAASLKDKQIVLKIKAGEGGRLFGAISSKEIAKEAYETIFVPTLKAMKQENRAFQGCFYGRAGGETGVGR